MNTEACSYKWF